MKLSSFMRHASMELVLPTRYYCKGDNCLGVDTNLAPGGTAVAFHFWNDHLLEPEQFDLGNFDDYLRRLGVGPVHTTSGTGYVQVVLIVEPTKYGKFQTLLKTQVWDTYRAVYHAIKRLRPERD